MNPAGLALFLFVATINTLPAQHAIFAPPPVVSPDPAQPHSLKPRDPEASVRVALRDVRLRSLFANLLADIPFL